MHYSNRSNELKEGMVEKRRQYALLGLIFISALLGCGEIGGSGQCGGAETSGVCVRLEEIKPVPKNAEVDAFQTPICPKSLAAEPFGSDNATVSVSALPLITPSKNAAIPRFVTVNEYEIRYTISQGNNCSGCPVNLTTVSKSFTKGIDTDGTSKSFDLILVDLSTKAEYRNLGGDPKQSVPYTATYVISGTDEFNNGFSVSGFTEFRFRNIDNCP